MSPNEVIAAAIRREREYAQLSLSALAAKADLAKSTLSLLEAGRGNPNVETLWAIASALDIPVSVLFENASSDTELIRADEGSSLKSGQSELSAVLLDRCPPNRRRDLFRTQLKPGAARTAQPHPKGTIEHAFLCAGCMKIGPLDKPVKLYPGDYYRFPGDVPHVYEAIDNDTLLLLIMDSPQ